MAVKIRWTDLAGAAAAGVLTAVAFPKFNLMFFAWISLIPLFFLLARTGPGWGFLTGWLAGTVFYAVLLYWIPSVPSHYGHIGPVFSGLIYLLFILLLGAFWGLFGLGFTVLRSRLGAAAFWIAPFLWITLEFAITHVLTGFPWGLLGLSQSANTAFIQVSSVTGVYGVSFLLVLFQSLFVLSIRNSKRLPFAFGVLAMVLVHLAGFLMLPKSGPGPEAFSAAVIQGNVSADIDWKTVEPGQVEDIFDLHLAMSRQAWEAGAGLIVWPELSVPMCFSCGNPLYERFRERLEEFVAETGTTLLLGTTETGAGEGVPGYYNAALALAPGRAPTRYAKMHLVPFGEYIPYRSIFGFAAKMTREIGGLTPGTSAVLHVHRDIPFGSPICYEIIFPGLVRTFVKNGARFLATITNDNWYGDSAAPYQHFAQAVFRAVENRRYVLRAASTGISGVIDPAGRVLARTRIGATQYLKGEITPSGRTTFYTRFGDVFAWAGLTITALFFMLSLFKRRS